MRLPEQFSVHVVDDKSNPVFGVAVILELRPRRKNTYYVGPLITDGVGVVRFSRTDCEQEIRRSQQMFVMDFDGDLASCAPTGVVSLHKPEYIARMISQYHDFPSFWGAKFHDPVSFFAALEAARNSEYEAASIIFSENDLIESKSLLLETRRKERV